MAVSGKLRKHAAEVMHRLEAANPGVIYDPLEILLMVAASPLQQWNLRVDAAKAARKALYPDLQTTQITGKDEGPVQIQAAMAVLAQDPKSAEAMEMLSLRMTEATRPLPSASVVRLPEPS